MGAYTKLAIVGFLLMIAGTGLCDFFTYVIRNYSVRGELYTQTVGDVIYYISIDLCLLSWAMFIRHKSKFEKLTRCLMQLAIDYFVWDMIFLCFTNPYVWNKSKLIVYGCSTLTFFVIYYFEYISLWHFNWMSNKKRTHHDKNKK